MNRAFTIVSLSATLCAEAFGQAFSSADATGTVPVAYVYVSARIGKTNRTEVHAFSAAADGRLAAVPGSPFADDVTFMAVNGMYLFGSDTAGTYIQAYAIEPDGTLRYAASSNVVKPNNDGCDSPGALFFDHTGATLYNLDYYASA